MKFFKCVFFFFYFFSILDAREFEWESQLRFYWVNEPDELMIRQCTGEFGYGYEYMGLNGRLVITPLTDRIYLTITQVNQLELKEKFQNQSICLIFFSFFVTFLGFVNAFGLCTWCVKKPRMINTKNFLFVSFQRVRLVQVKRNRSKI